jgi:hypothetical protein
VRLAEQLEHGRDPDGRHSPAEVQRTGEGGVGGKGRSADCARESDLLDGAERSKRKGAFSPNLRSTQPPSVLSSNPPGWLGVLGAGLLYRALHHDPGYFPEHPCPPRMCKQPGALTPLSGELIAAVPVWKLHVNKSEELPAVSPFSPSDL